MNSERKKTLKYTYKGFNLDDLKRLSTLVTDPEGFQNRYGKLLLLLNIKMDSGLLSTLLQFYDPLYHCFTFPDYQLVPTLEEYSQLIGLPILEDSPFPIVEKDPKEQDISKATCLGVVDIKKNLITKGGVFGLKA